MDLIEVRKLGWGSFNQAVCGLLLEVGVDMLTIGEMLGHTSFLTTMVYLHVRRPHLNSTPSPIDGLSVRQIPGCPTCEARLRLIGETPPPSWWRIMNSLWRPPWYTRV